VKETP